ncbi:MAG: signal recognition particle protein [Gammaproteobacteria bacterium]|nr:signal recognition particle protein [Gammaproteobacteria bacterium]MCH9744234.1 signal recognition particle protein [Gammaproteobacteria bacterium]
MFSNLSERLSASIGKLRGIGRLTEDNIQDTLGEVRRALLEADVALPVAKQFVETVREQAIGEEVIKNVRPGEAFIKLVQDELTRVLGSKTSELNLKAQPPVVILMAGLQGSGKTTTTAKLANWLQKSEKKKVMVTSADVYRPAAIEQLKTLASQIDVEYFPSTVNDKPTKIAEAALKQAKKSFMDILIIDTAGRLHIDDEMMQEIRAISECINPNETLLVVDSMAGQDAANTAKTFNDTIPLTGVVLTKTDGDARGGAALSMRMITEKPIKFMGVGEKIDALEPFHPDRVASRILGMGDIVSLVEEAQDKVDKKQADKFAKKLKKGKRFDFNDFLNQLQQMKKMGGMQSLMGKLPGMGQLPKKAKDMIDDKLFVRMEAIINSMTPKERAFPALLNGSRKRRISAGSGTNIQDVNKLMKQFTQMQKMLKRFKGDKMAKKMKHMQDQLPPELRGKLPDDLF